MRLRLSNSASIPELRQHFERSGFLTDRVSDDTIAVRQPIGTRRQEIELHLDVWRAMHPEVEVEVRERTP